MQWLFIRSVMLNNSKRLSWYSYRVWVTVCLFGMLVMLFTFYVWSENAVERANELRHHSFLLADELRQSSDDLTRMARLYVATGEARYKDYYQQILDIRDGRKPRPLDYQNIYWDLVLANGKPPRPDSGQAVPLLKLMEQVGFTPGELEELTEAKVRSDELTETEFAAMKMVESGGQDLQAKRNQALMMLFGDSYHQAKAAIMKPINEFYGSMDRRTLEAVQAAERRAAGWRWVFIVFGLWLAYMLWRSYSALRVTLAGRIHDTAIASSITAIAIAGLDGKLSYVNQAFVRLWRLQGPQDAIGRSPLEFWEKPEDAQAVIAELQRQGQWQGEMVARRADGSLADMQLSAHLVVDDKGQSLSMMGTFIDITDRKQAERELHASNVLLNSLFEHMPVMAFLKRASDLRLEKFNRAAEQLTGYSAQEMVGKSDRDMFPPEQAEFYTATDREVLASHRLIDVPQEPVTTRSGETRLLHTRKIGIYDADGKPAYLFGICIDITEQVRAEQTLREREASLRAILDNSPYMAWLKDREGRYLMVNKAYADYFGLADYSQVIGKTDFDFQKDRELAEKYRADDAEVMASRRQKHFEDPSFDGKTMHYMETFKTPVIDEQGNVLGTTGFARDITERRLAEEILQRYKQVIEHSREGYLVMDKEGNVLEANKAYADLTGYSIEELQHMNMSQLRGQGRTIEDVRTLFEKVIRQGTIQFETVHRHKDGHDLPIEVSAIFIAETQQISGFIRDISERKRADEILKTHQQVIQLSRDGFWMVDFQGNLVEVNQAYADMSGYTVDELLHMKIPQLEARERPEETKAHIEKIMAEGHDTFETVHRHKEGHLIDVEVSVVLVREKQQLAVFLRDITERKRAELELLRRQRMLNTAERMGQMGSWQLDIPSGTLHWSDEVYRIFELDPERFRPSYENFLGAIHPEDRDRVSLAYTRSLEARKEYDIEHRLQMGDGRIKWVRELCTTEFDALGKPLLSIGAVQDITLQKLAEERLREASVAFETHEAILITDKDVNIVRVNHAFEQLTGYTQQEVQGRNPHMLSAGRHSKAFYAEMWEKIIITGTWSGELWDRHKDGHEYPKWLTITAVRDEDGATTGYVGIFTDMTERRKAEEDIHQLAFYDPLTRLANRRLLQDRFRLALSMSTRSNLYGAVLFLDLDRFKTLNDTLGHQYGDQLLIDAALRIQECVREVDTVARLGGDEYVILADELDAGMQEASQKAALIADKIRVALERPFQIYGHTYHSSASIGVCLYRGTGESIDDLLKHADLAMYHAKDAGRNTVRFFDPLMQEAVDRRAALESDLRLAVPNGQLLLHYQVQVDNDLRATGAEALVRWLHPVRGMISPAQFIPIAEESSLILEVGQWVLDTACKQLAKWAREESKRELLVAVNVSGQQFRLPDFVERVEKAVHAHQIDPSRLKLELTESVVLSDVADVVKKMHALKGIGVRLSLDDFGTGYSSLSYLKQLPLDQLKIDQTFVRDVITDLNDAVLVKTIIDMAHNFRLNVIAEGVETDAQLAFLRQHGCMAYQGYLFSRPLPIADFEILLEKLGK